jgi:predicted nucleic acid-binding protein
VIIVSDSGPIIHLSLVGRIDLLPRLYGRILIPDLVYKEVVESGEGLPGSSELKDAEWVVRADHNPEATLFQMLSAELDPGEAAAIWLAVEREASLILSDDRQARLAAERLGIPVVGTIGILVQAKRKGLVSALSPLLLHLKSKGVWLSTSLIQNVLAEVGESLPSKDP